MKLAEKHEDILEKFNAILLNVQNGEGLCKARVLVGIGESTFYTWLSKYKGFEEAYKKAQKKGAEKNAERIRMRVSTMALSVLERRLEKGDLEKVTGVGKNGEEVNLQTAKEVPYQLVMFALKKAFPEIFADEEQGGNTEQMQAPNIFINTKE